MLACVSKGANLLANFQPRLASFRANFPPRLASLRANFQPPLASLHPSFQPRLASLHANFQPRLASLHANFQPHVPNYLKIRIPFYLKNYLIRYEIRNYLLGRKLPKPDLLGMSRSATPATRNEATPHVKPPKRPLLRNLPYPNYPFW